MTVSTATLDRLALAFAADLLDPAASATALPQLCQRVAALFDAGAAWMVRCEPADAITVIARYPADVPVRPERAAAAIGSGLASDAAGAAVSLLNQGRAVAVLGLDRGGGLPAAATARLARLGRRLGPLLAAAAAQEMLRLQAAAAEAVKKPILVTDAAGRIVWANSAFSRISGHSLAEARGTTPPVLTAATGQPWTVLRQGGDWQGEVVERFSDAKRSTVEQTITPIRDAAGARYFVVLQDDITTRKRAEERVRYLSTYDPLTGLPNRILFRARLAEAVTEAKARGAIVAVHFLDLDHFSRINDVMGRSLGDRLLKAIVERLTATATDAHTIARVGGDEFAVIQTGLADSRDAAGLARRITAAVSRPYDLGGHEVHVGASIGIALHPEDGHGTDDLISNAEMAMYRAVQEAPNHFRFFSREMNQQMQARLALERDLRRAFGKRFVLHYQPQRAAVGGRVVGLEALVRWRRHERGLVQPGAFIPLAEASGMILPLGDWVLRAACRQARSWLDQGLALVPVSVNLSAAQLLESDLADTVMRVLAETGLEPRWLELELTETAVMRDGEAAVRMLGRLAACGIRLAIDDFGAGYSSLNYLKRFPVHKLKMDAAFIRDLETDPHDAEIVRAIIALGHGLGLEVVAEGVETRGQLDYLAAQGCDVVQGHLLGRPVPAEQVAALLRD